MIFRYSIVCRQTNEELKKIVKGLDENKEEAEKEFEEESEDESEEESEEELFEEVSLNMHFIWKIGKKQGIGLTD